MCCGLGENCGKQPDDGGGGGGDDDGGGGGGDNLAVIFCEVATAVPTYRILATVTLPFISAIFCLK